MSDYVYDDNGYEYKKFSYISDRIVEAVEPTVASEWVPAGIPANHPQTGFETWLSNGAKGSFDAFVRLGLIAAPEAEVEESYW
jgi:hypothetical protein